MGNVCLGQHRAVKQQTCKSVQVPGSGPYRALGSGLRTDHGPLQPMQGAAMQLHPQEASRALHWAITNKTMTMWKTFGVIIHFAEAGPESVPPNAFEPEACRKQLVCVVGSYHLLSILLCKQGKLLMAWVSISPTIRLVALHGMGRMSAEVPWRGGFCGISRQDKKAPHNSDFVHIARRLPRVSGLDKFGKLWINRPELQDYLNPACRLPCWRNQTWKANLWAAPANCSADAGWFPSKHFAEFWSALLFMT